MVIVSESAPALKGFIGKSGLGDLARAMVLRMILEFIMHRGRMSCSQAAGSIASKSIHRGQLTRFLARPRWQKHDFNAPLRMALLQMETGKGKCVFVIDATLVSQAGDTAYDAAVVREACEDRDYTWIVPANPERVYEGPQGKRPKLRSRLKDCARRRLDSGGPPSGCTDCALRTVRSAKAVN